MAPRSPRHEAAEVASAARVPRRHGPHGPPTFSAPLDILAQLAPPGCRVGLNGNDWRWTSTFSGESEYWIDTFKQKNFTRKFEASTWKAKLREVHQFIWNKWDLAREQQDFALPEGALEQTPGHIGEEIFAQLAPVVAGLPAPKKYSRAS